MNKLSLAKKVALGAVATGSVAMAASSNTAFASLYDQFTTWFSGSLGKILALLGFAGTFIVYMMTHKAGVLFIGIIISLVAGGLIGIANTFFSAGRTAFPSSSAA